MKQHRYRVTLEHLADAKGAASTYDAPLRFEVGNHDDVFAIVARLRQRDDLPPDAATPLAVGLKLFSEVMLENRGHPLFAEFAPHFRDFMKTLKQGPSAPAEPA
ncbi:protein of unknown function [Pseudoxanthomonas sp. CF385]|uniref:DUF3861 domain-containing protein n=1 Tax=Pseudoxanthomonas sp. CF385 TaxID=1881042 RepID=UPI00088E9D59|nr:DUF3861 domain-containing protein [Pseudoxanthomonas sp. CF385]SDR18128.1 protein of unknown function [Pseudoxanthomonas sp. CF385]